MENQKNNYENQVFLKGNKESVSFFQLLLG